MGSAKGYKFRGIARYWSVEAAKDLHLASKLDYDEEISAVLKKVGVIFMFFLQSYLYNQICVFSRPKWMYTDQTFFRFQSWRLLKILVVLFQKFSELC